MKNIFIVKSPLQLLNAIEARHHFNLALLECVLIVFGDKKSYPQMLRLIQDQNEWGAVIVLNKISIFVNAKNIVRHTKASNGNMFLSTFQRSSSFLILKFHKLAKIYGNINYLFVGDNHNALIRDFINVASYKSVVLLDDGVGAVYMAEIRKKSHRNVPNIKFKKKFKIWIKRIFQGLNDRQVDRACFFSAYNLDLDERDNLVLNEYKYLRSKLSSVEQVDSVYFLGGPLSEVGLMSEADYIKQVKMIRMEYAGYEFVYVTHRRENTTKLNLIKEIQGVVVRSFDFPVEYQFAVIGPIPSIVVSFVTSALENLRLIMGDKMKVISYRFIKGTYNNESRTDAIYDYYSKNVNDHFCLLQLEPSDNSFDSVKDS